MGIALKSILSRTQIPRPFDLGLGASSPSCLLSDLGRPHSPVASASSSLTWQDVEWGGV